MICSCQSCVGRVHTNVFMIPCVQAGAASDAVKEVYKKDDFFDALSCEALDRGNERRPMSEQVRGLECGWRIHTLEQHYWLVHGGGIRPVKFAST